MTKKELNQAVLGLTVVGAVVVLFTLWPYYGGRSICRESRGIWPRLARTPHSFAPLATRRGLLPIRPTGAGVASCCALSGGAI